jgi:hypothetical protein
MCLFAASATMLFFVFNLSTVWAFTIQNRAVAKSNSVVDSSFGPAFACIY